MTNDQPKTRSAALGYLVEECGEVQAAVGKTLRWGLKSTDPEREAGDPLHGENNREWILRELKDLEHAIATVRGFL